MSVDPTNPYPPAVAAIRAQAFAEAAEICDEAGAVCTAKALNDQAAGAFMLMERFQRKSNEAQYAATLCDPTIPCEGGGDPCQVHERLLAHAEDDHDLCGPDCGLLPDLALPDGDLGVRHPEVASQLNHLHPEVRTLVVAVDALRDAWMGADELTRQKLWNVVNEAQEVVSPTADFGLHAAIADVIAERHRQDGKWGVQNWHDFEGISVLAEEVGEAAQAANEANFSSGSTPGDFTHLRTELVQVAAVAVHHVQIIDRRPKRAAS